jgi:serine phosphatase RsbU (regulator of sigma subunit)/type II secretory pathway pseudopilin PulG
MATTADSSADKTQDAVTDLAALAAAASAASARRRGFSGPGLAVLVVGIAVTVAMAWVSRGIYDNNENRLLGLRVRELSLVLSSAITSVQTPLASAAELADDSMGNARKFRSFMAPYVGPGRQFVSASLLPLGSARPTPTVVVGTAPALFARPAQAATFFSRAVRSDLLSVTGILGSAQPRLGYEFNTPGVRTGFAVYAENVLPKNRRSKLASQTGFADLDYAIYLGRSRPTPKTLLLTDISRFPITGRRASRIVPFGDSAFTLVVTPNTSLGGAFFEDLQWIIAVLGVLLSLAAATLADRLVRRRREAEQLAGLLDRVAEENLVMYTEQRSIAQTLQHALLPETLPQLGGLASSARYVPATSGIDVGGDWYDLVEIDDQRVLLVVGDVSGHGLRAATTMASLRFAALAYASSDPQPGSVLSRLSNFVNDQPHSYFATALCAVIDVDGHRVTVASAGHIAPLLIEGATGRFVELEVGVPIGVAREAPYLEVTISVSPGATLLAFTDGLVERRGEVLDVGLSRLREAATAKPLALDDLVEMLARDLASDGHHDDSAILGVRWRE